MTDKSHEETAGQIWRAAYADWEASHFKLGGFHEALVKRIAQALKAQDDGKLKIVVMPAKPETCQTA